MVDSAILTQGSNLDIGVYKVRVQKLQEKNDFCKQILNILNKNHLYTGQLYFIRGNILMTVSILESHELIYIRLKNL